MASPLVEALDEPGADYDPRRWWLWSSTAALFSAAGQGRLLPHLPNIIITDAVGSRRAGNKA